MTERVRKRLEFYNARAYRKTRVHLERDISAELEGLPPMAAHAKLFEAELAAEEPKFYGDDPFGFNFYRDGYFNTVRYFENLSIDYAGVLSQGLDGIRARAEALYAAADDTAKEFYDAMFVCFDACRDLVSRYRAAAAQNGLEPLAAALAQVPFRPARDYYEALVTLKFLQFTLRRDHNSHVTLGRFDKYMKPYFEASLENGATEAELLELTELFFLSLNFDADLYFGMQQGDNGQSMVLGGVDRDGVTEVFGPLGELCLQASEELKLIDPKINLRVNKHTPLSLYERGTRLTKQGLGFPQYSNDDVVIPALVKWGYDVEDARDYCVAACWEFIIPAYGGDVVNIDAFSFPLSIDRATRKSLATAKTFEEFLQAVDAEIAIQCDEIVERCRNWPIPCEPYYSAFIRPCIERGRDLSHNGAKYRNYGVHGVGISTAADALAAIEKTVFDERSLTPARLIAALDADFEGEEALRQRLLACPKMGNNDDYVDSLGAFIMDSFARHLDLRPNDRGGIFRAGTGSAMYYLLSSRDLGATADGRHAGKPFASSFSPSLDARLNGPLSAILSFTKADLTPVCNGGPFTIEIHDTVFRNAEGEKKVAQLIKSYIDLGGHQIQINAINRDLLLDAQKNPDKYPNLIVRVWGWSGYFNEIDVEYQNHVIRRAEFTFG